MKLRYYADWGFVLLLWFVFLSALVFIGLVSANMIYHALEREDALELILMIFFSIALLWDFWMRCTPGLKKDWRRVANSPSR